MPQKGFFSSLFDISFSSLITTKVIKVLYVLALIGIGLVALFFIIGAFTRSAAAGLLTLVILAPLASLFYVIYTRVILEFIIVVFRISEHSAEMVELQRQQLALATGTPASPAAPASQAPPAPQAPAAQAPPPPPPPAQPTATPDTTVVRPVQPPPPSEDPGSGSGSAS